VADVSGKSVGAALLVSALHAALQLLLDEGRDLGTIATELNRHIHRWSAENKFVTMVLATIDPEAGVIRYVNAGHNPAFIVANGEVHALHSHGLPIGLLPQSRYSVQTAQFAPGSLLAVYSDGISEAENAQDEEFGEQGLQNLLLANASEPCQTLAQRVSAAVEEFVGDLPQKDDQTLVLVRHTSA
jgi:serine phosphatase RsbU (regulator of sigma subunit)